MALVERNLVDVTAIGVHDMQHQCRFLQVLIQRRKLWLAFIQQYRAGLTLA